MKNKDKAPVTFEQLVNDEPAPQPALEDKTPVFRIKFVESGFTAAGKVWLAGEVFEAEAGSEAYEGTKDTQGNSWLDLAGEPEEQQKRFGKILFTDA